MADIEVFVQGRGIPSIILVRVPEEGTVRDLLEVVRRSGARLENGAPVIVMLENTDEPLTLEVPLAVAGIGPRSRVHVHTCLRIEVTVNFNGSSKERAFPPSVTVGHVHRWAVGKEGFNLPELDATEHALQICGSATRPNEDIHIGALVSVPACMVCFDLVAKRRVEGAV
jgi:hypothetical protein